MKKKQNKQISVFVIRFIFSLRCAGNLKKNVVARHSNREALPTGNSGQNKIPFSCNYPNKYSFEPYRCAEIQLQYFFPCTPIPP